MLDEIQVWGMDKVMMMTDKRSTRTESYPFVTLTITNSTLSGLPAKLSLRNEGPINYRLCPMARPD